jgi:hypothetical protein
VYFVFIVSWECDSLEGSSSLEKDL